MRNQSLLHNTNSTPGVVQCRAVSLSGEVVLPQVVVAVPLPLVERLVPLEFVVALALLACRLELVVLAHHGPVVPVPGGVGLLPVVGADEGVDGEGNGAPEDGAEALLVGVRHTRVSRVGRPKHLLHGCWRGGGVAGGRQAGERARSSKRGRQADLRGSEMHSLHYLFTITVGSQSSRLA